MKSTRYLLIVLTLISFSHSACKKSEPTKTDYLTRKPWMLSSIYVRIAGSEWSDATTSYTCRLDDTYTYTIDGKYIKDEGAIKCSPENEQKVTTNWALSDEGKMITYNDKDGPSSYTITQLDNNTLIIVDQYTLGINSGILIFIDKIVFCRHRVS